MDFSVSNHGSVCLVHPKSKRAHEWIQENVCDDAQTWGGALVVEPRYLEALVTGMQLDGLVLGKEAVH